MPFFQSPEVAVPPLLSPVTARPLSLFPDAVFCRCPLIAAAVTRFLDIIISYLGTSPRNLQNRPVTLVFSDRQGHPWVNSGQQ